MPNIIKSLIELGGDIANTQVGNTNIANSIIGNPLAAITNTAVADTLLPKIEQYTPLYQEHSGANVHIRFDKPVKLPQDEVAACAVEVVTNLYFYTDDKDIEQEMQSYIRTIHLQLNTQFNKNFTTTYQYEILENGEKNSNYKTLPLTFIFTVESFKVKTMQDIQEKAREGILRNKNYCFIHLNNGKFPLTQGFSDGCIGSWSIKNIENHYAHEMAHLLGYLNVVRTESPWKYRSNDSLAACQHPAIGELPEDEKLSIMSSDPNRQVIQQDIDNLNFGKGLGVDGEFWRKGNSSIDPSIFKGKYSKYGIWEESAKEVNAYEHVKKVGQRRPNNFIQLITHANFEDMFKKIKTNEK